MKAVFVLRSMTIVAGIERVVSDKMNYLATKGHEVTLVTYQQGGCPLAYGLHATVNHVDLDIPYYRIYRYSLPKRLWKMWQMKRLFRRKFHRLVLERQPDVIVTVTNVNEFMCQITSAPVGKIIVEAHGAFPAIMAARSLTERLKRSLHLRAISHADMVITLTQSDKPYWQPYVPHVVAVPNPVTVYPEKPLSYKTQGRILAVGRLEPQKRFDRLVDAFAMIADRYTDWFVDIYGKGGDEQALLRQIDSLGLTGRVRLKGHTGDIYAEYQSSEFFVLSSDYEGFGLVVVEAMACGIPVVSVDCPFGPSEIITDGTDGLLCKPDAADLAAKMEWMITHEGERHQMGSAAHQAAARYRKEVVMPLWEQAYLLVYSA